MKALIIGYGSIGSRHASVLKKLGCKVGVVSRRESDFEPRYTNLKSAIDEWNPDYVVIANKTNEHYPSLLELARFGFEGTVFVEKPLFIDVREAPADQFENIFVGYNMRFSPLIQRLRDEIRGKRVISVQAYAGQYLPDWRPQRDYRLSYSSKKFEGGGVLRDLSHELDFLTWLLGGWKSVIALGGHFSDLEIDSDDIFSLMMVTSKCPVVSVQLNYLDKISHREVMINTNRDFMKLDFINKTFQIDDKVESFQFDRDLSYHLQHEAVLNKDYKNLCSYKHGLDVMLLMQAAEKSAYSTSNRWITK